MIVIYVEKTVRTSGDGMSAPVAIDQQAVAGADGGHALLNLLSHQTVLEVDCVPIFRLLLLKDSQEIRQLGRGEFGPLEIRNIHKITLKVNQKYDLSDELVYQKIKNQMLFIVN